jgi:hypothetical protein
MNMRGIWQLGAWAVLIVALVAATSSVSLAQSVGTLHASPSGIELNVPTPVTFTISANDPALIPQSVNLLRLQGSGLPAALVGAMRDDGIAGDAAAGDRVFTLRVTVTPTSTSAYVYAASVAFRGRMLRVQSQTATVAVTVPQGLEPTVYGNRTDPGLIRLRAASGVQIDLFGTKDAAGLATGISGLSADLPSGPPVTVLFDQEYRPVNIQTNNGISLNLQWLSSNQALVNVSDSQSTETGLLVTTLDFGLTESRRATSIIQIEAISLSAADAAEARVTVGNCAGPVSAATVVVKAGASTLFAPYFASPDANQPGTYVAKIPTLDPNAGVNATDKCLAAGRQIIGQLNPANQQRIVGLVRDIINALIATGRSAAFALAGPLAVFAATTLPALLAEAALAGVAALATCPLIFVAIDRYVNSATILLQPVVKVGSITTEGTAVSEPAIGPFEDMLVRTPGGCGPFIGHAEGQSYNECNEILQTWSLNTTARVLADGVTGTMLHNLTLTSSFPTLPDRSPQTSVATCASPFTAGPFTGESSLFSGTSPRTCFATIFTVSGTITPQGMSGTVRIQNDPTFSTHACNFIDTGNMGLALRKQ